MMNILSQSEINYITDVCSKYNIKEYKINNDGTIDVVGDVNFANENLYDIPLKFNKVDGDFNCNINYLTSLIGSPIIVTGTYSCSNNDITSLEGCPKKVGKAFYCRNNNYLITIHGCSIIPSVYNINDSNVSSFYDIGNNKELPSKLSDYLQRDNQRDNKINIFIKYQEYYNVWTPEFNEDGFNELVEDIEQGLG